MERVVEIFLELVKIPSPSRKERSVAVYSIQRLKKLGLTYKEDDTGNAIEGLWEYYCASQRRGYTYPIALCRILRSIMKGSFIVT